MMKGKSREKERREECSKEDQAVREVGILSGSVSFLAAFTSLSFPSHLTQHNHPTTRASRSSPVPSVCLSVSVRVCVSLCVFWGWCRGARVGKSKTHLPQPTSKRIWVGF